MPMSPLVAGAATALLATLVSGCSTPPAAAAEEKKPEPVAVKAVAAEAATLRRTTTQPATVHAYYTADIYAKVSGYVREVPVDIGDHVKQGDVLAVIDVPEIKKQLLVADARVARSEAQVKRAESGKRLAEANLASARAGVVGAESRIASADALLQAGQAEFTRTQSLVEQRSVQQRLLDEARQRLDSGKADVESAKALVTMAQSQVAVAEASVAAAQSEIEAAKADTQVAEAQRGELQVMLEFAELQAPFDGVVTHRGVAPGDLVRAVTEARGVGSPHFIVTQLDKVRVRTMVPEAEASLVDVGDAVSIALSSARLPAVEGKVTRTSGSLDPSTRTLTVEVELPNPDGKLLPGMYGEATIVLFEKPDAVSLPASAIRFRTTGESYVYALDNASEVSIQDVTLGYDSGTTIEIASPLAAGQKVIDAHLKRFRDGDVVRVLEN
ncbi:Multidrug resistance protein MdtA precursor [Pirellulimonas nuda]|uniref:Multidrug resistance protein MdtA n=1 Tax=Pirellulimonas nuda TaxID=2528009 RepID=A0A518D8U0_9BACT|nr:efflux RND transporter periplasmic adaptor subunit [Pirellulimonas nuda]QDU87888.1 Multidrug resistance protein MdtA precursor [Pirellulimonas nuda]